MKYTIEHRHRPNRIPTRTVEAETPHAAAKLARATAPEGYYVAAVDWDDGEEGREVLFWCASCDEPLLEGDEYVSTADDVELCAGCAAGIAEEQAS